MPPPLNRKPRTAENIARGAKQAKIYKRDIGPVYVARALNRAKLKYVLVGMHAAKSRTMVDVDVIVQTPEKASKAIAAAFGGLTMVDTPVVIRFKHTGSRAVIRLLKPLGHPLWARLLDVATILKIRTTPVRVLSVEGILASRFLAIASPHRHRLDMREDGRDFARIVSGDKKLDLALLKDLGELVYAGGGRQILKLVSSARSGRRLEF